MNEGWRRTSSTAGALAAGLLALLVGAATGRPEIAVLGVAPVVAAAWDLARRPGARAEVTVRRGRARLPDQGLERVHHTPGSGPIDDAPGSGRLRAHVHVDVSDGTAAVRLRVGRAGSTTAEALVRVDRARDITVTVATVRTGPQDLVRADVRVVGAGFASIDDPVSSDRQQVLLLPSALRLGPMPLPFRLRGLTGEHESQRPGDGGGLRDVHPFAPGDRLRRVDWRVTARRSPDLSELYVRRTFALADAVVMLVVDSRDDVGPDPATWSGFSPVRPQDATSLDLARQAAASIARDLVAAGDRVGLDDLGVRRRPVAPGGGRRQLDRIVHRLALIHPEGEPTVRLRAPQLPSGVLVVVFSTFLDDSAARAARSWRRSGHRVVAIDVLPRLRVGALNRRERLPLRLVLMERTDRLADLTAQGVELVPWATGDPAVELILLSRRSHRRPGVGVAR
ncbi:MAG: DUF58 domain-containing protein [Cellulomonas sp.]